MEKRTILYGRIVRRRFGNKRPKRMGRLVSAMPQVGALSLTLRSKTKKLILETLSDAKTKNGGNTILHCAVLNGDIGVLKYLIENGALINAKNKNGDYPLHIAAKVSNIEILKCLIENGALGPNHLLL